MRYNDVEIVVNIYLYFGPPPLIDYFILFIFLCPWFIWFIHYLAINLFIVFMRMIIVVFSDYINISTNWILHIFRNVLNRSGREF